MNGGETGTSARQKLHFLETGFRIRHTMVMERAGSRWPSRVRYGGSLEYAIILSKGRPHTVNLLRDRPNACAGQVKDFQRRERDGGLTKAGKCRPIAASGCRKAVRHYSAGSVHSTKDRRAFVHPAVMPEKMSADHILS